MAAWVAAVTGVMGLAAGPPLNRLIDIAPNWVHRDTPPDFEGDGVAMAPGRDNGRTNARRHAAAVMLVTCGLGAGAGLRFGLTWTLPVVAILFAGLVVLAWCDAEHFVLPKRVVHLMALVGGGLMVIAAGATGGWHRLGIAAVCGAVAFAVFLAINVASPSGLAFGDVRLAGVIGLLVGWLGIRAAVGAFLVASALGAIAGVALLVTGRGGRRSRLPYGVFLAAGAVAATLAYPSFGLG